MTAFDHFQIATCHISEGDKPGAVKHIDKAIKRIDRDGIDANMRSDLVALRVTLCAS